jgi:dinuclear metal center YbgI/SA1388 family protein
MQTNSGQPRSIAEVVRELELRAPSGTAESWDNIGLLVGDAQAKTMGGVVSIDLTREAIDLAVQHNYRLIVNHHPCIFPKNKGLSRLTPDHLAYEAIQKGIAVVAAHTNFDQCALEVVSKVADGLGIVAKGRLIDQASGSLLKLVTFVPLENAEKVRQAICEAGAGQVGNYDSCTFGMTGEGTFRGNEGTKPFIGHPGRLERVPEIRIETIFPAGMRKCVIAALVEAHPDEEVAYDIYPLEQAAGGQGVIRGLGYGVWGEFPTPKPFSELTKDVKSLFNIHGFWITDPVPSFVSRVGFVAGKGASFVESASGLKCDLFITGEAGYHTALGGSRRGMAVMELGHRESEKFFVDTMKDWLLSLGLGSVEAQAPTQKFWSGG